MQYGLAFPYVDAYTLIELAQAAEHAGWDGVFYWVDRSYLGYATE